VCLQNVQSKLSAHVLKILHFLQEKKFKIIRQFLIWRAATSFAPRPQPLLDFRLPSPGHPSLALTTIVKSWVRLWQSATLDIAERRRDLSRDSQSCSHWRTQRGVRGDKPPLNLQKIVLCVCKIYSLSPAPVFIKSKILYRKTLEIVRYSYFASASGGLRPPDPLARAPPREPLHFKILGTPVAVAVFFVRKSVLQYVGGNNIFSLQFFLAGSRFYERPRIRLVVEEHVAAFIL